MGQGNGNGSTEFTTFTEVEIALTSYLHMSLLERSYDRFVLRLLLDAPHVESASLWVGAVTIEWQKAHFLASHPRCLWER